MFRVVGVGGIYGPGFLSENIASSNIDVVAAKVFGRADGEGVLISNIPLGHKTWTAGLGFLNVNHLFMDLSYPNVYVSHYIKEESYYFLKTILFDGRPKGKYTKRKDEGNI